MSPEFSILQLKILTLFKSINYSSFDNNETNYEIRYSKY